MESTLENSKYNRHFRSDNYFNRLKIKCPTRIPAADLLLKNYFFQPCFAGPAPTAVIIQHSPQYGILTEEVINVHIHRLEY